MKSKRRHNCPYDGEIRSSFYDHRIGMDHIQTSPCGYQDVLCPKCKSRFERMMRNTLLAPLPKLHVRGLELEGSLHIEGKDDDGKGGDQ